MRTFLDAGRDWRKVFTTLWYFTPFQEDSCNITVKRFSIQQMFKKYIIQHKWLVKSKLVSGCSVIFETRKYQTCPFTSHMTRPSKTTETVARLKRSIFAPVTEYRGRNIYATFNCCSSWKKKLISSRKKSGIKPRSSIYVLQFPDRMHTFLLHLILIKISVPRVSGYHLTSPSPYFSRVLYPFFLVSGLFLVFLWFFSFKGGHAASLQPMSCLSRSVGQSW